MVNKLQRGFTFIEVLTTIFLVTLFTAFAAPAAVWKVEEAGMEATGVYMGVLKSALEKYNLTNHGALAAGNPVAGFAVPLAPTINELRAANFIASPSFPNTTPQRMTVSTLITPQNCPGAACRFFGVAYTNMPLVDAVGRPRYDLIPAYINSPGIQGAGAFSSYGREGTLTSAHFSIANPAGAVGAILAVGTYLDEGIYASFVKLGDVRDPSLRGGLTIAGVAGTSTLALNVGGNTNITGSLVVGAGGILTAGSITSSAKVTANSLQVTGFAVPGSVCSLLGEIRMAQNLAPPAIQHGGVMCVQDGFSGTNRWTVLNTGVGLGDTCTNGETGKQLGRFDMVCSGNKWIPIGNFMASGTPGAACASNGSLVYDVTTTPQKALFCAGGKYVAVSQYFVESSAGFPCTVAGSLAYDSFFVGQPSQALVCRRNPNGGVLSYYRMNDVTNHFSLHSEVVATADQQLGAVTCDSSSGLYYASPIIIPGTETSPDGGFSRWLDPDGAGGYFVRLKNGAGTNLTSSSGAAQVTVQYRCYAP